MVKIISLVALCGICLLALLPNVVYGLAYGRGTYGSCQYSTCGITLSSSATVAINITPTTTATRCSVAKDDVTVTTGASTGYTLSLKDGDATNTLKNGTKVYSAVTYTQTTPNTLVANKWGYRVDGIGGFGAGPTTALTNVAIPASKFALVPLSSASANTIATTAVAAPTGATTSVWYGLCISYATNPAGTYSDSVVYTAVTN